MNDQAPIGPPASGKGVNSFVLNLVLPGLGSLVAGQTGVGVGQLALFLVGIGVLLRLSLTLIVLGLILMAGAWIWSAVTGFQMMSDTTKA